MKKTLRILCLVIAVILCMATAAAEELTLTIAHIGPQTGGAAVYGLATYRGAQIADRKSVV